MEFRARMRAAFDNTARETASAIICEKLRALPEWQAAKVVMGYAPMGDEPDIEPILCTTRATTLPRPPIPPTDTHNLCIHDGFKWATFPFKSPCLGYRGTLPIVPLSGT